MINISPSKISIKIFIAFLLIMMSLVLVWFFIKESTRQKILLKCEYHSFIRKKTGYENEVAMDLKSNVYVYSNGTGSIITNGAAQFSNADKKYILNRENTFRYLHTDADGFFHVNFDGEIKRGSDTFPLRVFDYYNKNDSESNNVSYKVKIRKISNDLFVFYESTTPKFICVQY